MRDNKNNTNPDRTIYQDEGSLHLGRLIMQLRKLEDTPRSFGEAGVLTPSEIHTIDAIGCDEGLLMSELARRLGITKGAVTQIVDRLETKALVKRSPHPAIARGIIVSLTETGMIAYNAHLELHMAFYDRLRESFTEEEIKIFEKCVSKLCEVMSE
jgi:DNA-binding MarR family transcriptional regulator